ncbi:MAG: PTS sugar transporter subunit IIA [Eubacterium aggregans]|uniref:PTS system IIA component, Gat family n=1 Tax=Eubacterium aggregans TaxID=81409 RepID=A0A1H4AZJ3_9FIRM|nr:PTS sugar transporter subunit IIA [Eubacterium aggregans]MDD4691653.1 PTS sugar transporter subunit IIA [Eubacterium aggregans]MEA5073961.1 PTS sugar transporter subunit IIA [Eubacterium aggregans]SEA41217.1 PTS system IIA component, Gat family [Eubacterium aggregans]
MENSIGMLKEALIYMDLEAEDKFDALKTMAEDFVKQGYGKASFTEAVLEREKNFATGIPTETIGVAIPHADPIHVADKALGIAILKKPVDFVILGDDTATVPVEMIFMIATNEPDGHIETLQKLMEIFQNSELLGQIRQAKNKEAVLEIFSQI